MNIFRPLAATLLLFFVTAAAGAGLQGKVVGISDGDTFTLLTDEDQQVTIRLAQIDAPESGQPYGSRSKQVLSGLIYGKDGLVNVETTDRYGRVVGTPLVGNLDVCHDKVRMSTARAYRQYLRGQGLLILEADAIAESEI